MFTSNINPASPASNQFHPLPPRQPPANSVSRARNADAAFPAFGFDALLGTGGTSSSILDVADFIDLSPEAQNLLDFFSGAAGGLTGNPVLDNNGIILTDVQQAQISAIIAKFRDAPFSADTFHDIMQELKAAGLSPEQLAAQSEGSPLALSNIFLRALDGQDSTGATSDFLTFSNQDDRATRDAYLRQIFSEWERISTQFRPLAIANFIQPPPVLRREDE